MKTKYSLLTVFFLCAITVFGQESSWIRINQLGYTPDGRKIAVFASKEKKIIEGFALRDSVSGKIVFRGEVSEDFGHYGPFRHTRRLDFSVVKQPGVYFLEVGDVTSPVVKIDKDVYKGSADFILRYMRQQRSLFNPFLQDSCHTHDGFTLYAESAGIQDSTHIDAGGGWHDASDYLQYATTSANATFHLLAAYRDFPDVFEDEKLANGLVGRNGIADVLDEAKWGLDWLLKLHPEPHLMFNQIADDRDHASLRIPTEDPFYGRGNERPVYFIDGKPQQRGEFLNNTTGTSSTAAKFVSAFNLGSDLFKQVQPEYAYNLERKAKTALDFAHIKLGVTQTVSVKSPYIYAEENWKDDMQLAFSTMYGKYGERIYKEEGLKYARQEQVTEWMVRDTANHYQYYPFINLGHYELAKHVNGENKVELMGYYRDGIEQVWNRAKQNAFYRGVPFIWCSNNLTVAFAIQCLWYQELSGDNQYEDLAQANFDWLFGLNPWGTSMVYGLPSWGDTPTDPHSAFTHLENYPIDGGLVDGPVYTNIFENLIGIQLHNEDAYAEFQSDLAVYHDDFGDYSTNEPTMDGTASLVYLMAAMESSANNVKSVKDEWGAIIRGDSLQKRIALVFTAHDLNDGNEEILNALESEQVPGSFFLTGDYLKNKRNATSVSKMIADNHYIGPHSDKHLLYAPWEDRQQTSISERKFVRDMRRNVRKLERFGVKKEDYQYYIPPYEWYNKAIVEWSDKLGMQVVNFTPGLRTAADYTFPEMGAGYIDSKALFESVLKEEEDKGLNGYIILIHLGTDDRRTDKFYSKLPNLIRELKERGYQFSRIDSLLE